MVGEGRFATQLLTFIDMISAALSHRVSHFSWLELVVGEGFEPSKSVTADLQSAPFGRSGTPPGCVLDGAGCRSRTGDLLITSQLLYQLS